MNPDPPKTRPLERFWPYADLPEQPTEEELAALDPDLHEALFGAKPRPFSITIVFPTLDIPEFARALDIAGEPAALLGCRVWCPVGGRPVRVEQRDRTVGVDVYRFRAQPAVHPGPAVAAQQLGGQPVGDAQQRPGGQRRTERAQRRDIG